MRSCPTSWIHRWRCRRRRVDAEAHRNQFSSTLRQNLRRSGRGAAERGGRVGGGGRGQGPPQGGRAPTCVAGRSRGVRSLQLSNVCPQRAPRRGGLRPRRTGAEDPHPAWISVYLFLGITGPDNAERRNAKRGCVGGGRAKEDRRWGRGCTRRGGRGQDVGTGVTQEISPPRRQGLPGS